MFLELMKTTFRIFENINDLGFFHLFSCRVKKYRNINIEALWKKIKDTYYTYDTSALTSLWELKSECVQEIIKTKAGLG